EYQQFRQRILPLLGQPLGLEPLDALALLLSQYLRQVELGPRHRRLGPEVAASALFALLEGSPHEVPVHGAVSWCERRQEEGGGGHLPTYSASSMRPRNE